MNTLNYYDVMNGSPSRQRHGHRHPLSWERSHYKNTEINSNTSKMPFYGSTTFRENPKETEFKRLATIWGEETILQSNMTIKAIHPAYQQIIGMGIAVVPYILKEFQSNRFNDWFWALHAILKGDVPITTHVAGDIKAMAEIWVKWGERNGFL